MRLSARVLDNRLISLKKIEKQLQNLFCAKALNKIYFPVHSRRLKMPINELRKLFL